MRKSLLAAAVITFAALALATAAPALEKTAVRLTDERQPRDWNAGLTCSLAYWNICTGWLWLWSGWSPNDMLGVCYDVTCCPPPAALETTLFYVWTAAPSGWGYDGTISVSNADADGCPVGAPLASQLFNPMTGWNAYDWGVTVGSRFVVQAVMGPGHGAPIVFPSDHPAAGPTGPVACGLCYPADRPAHTYYYGTAGSPLCPGSSLHDGVCAAELWMNAGLSCATSAESASWGAIKNLYR